MPDIMKFIVNEEAIEDDPQGNLLSLDPWSESLAEQIAAEEGIELTPKHWEVIHFLRDHFRQYGEAHYAREIVQLLESRYAHEGGRKLLYQLFPGGPVRQASKIGGLPIPAHSVDPSFGTAQ